MGAQQRSPAPRRWTVEPMIDEGTGELYLDSQEVSEELNGLGFVLRRMGGAFVVTAERVEVTQGVYQTARIHVQYESWVPARRLEPEQQRNGAPAEEEEDAPAG